MKIYDTKVIMIFTESTHYWKKDKRKVQGVPQSQTAALPRPQEEEETDKSKQAQTEQTYEKHKKLALSTPSEVIAILKGLKTQEQNDTRKTFNKSPRRINHKATKSKTNTGTTALERSVEPTTGEFKALLQLANFTLCPDATLNTEIHKNSVRIKAPNSVNASKRKHKNQINHYNKQRRVLMANSTVCQSKWKPMVEPRRAKPKTYRQAPTHWLKFYEEAVIESEARTAVVQLKSEA